MSDASILVCFAVKEEAKFFSVNTSGRIKKLVTGMGKRNAAANFRKAITEDRPGRVITAGFAGGLNPQLLAGTVVFDDGVKNSDRKRLEGMSAKFGKFYCAEKVAVTASEKWVLWQSTGADAVEMESGVITQICREENIPCATVRVISDAAGEDLPIDFNALMTADEKIDFTKLAGSILKNPAKIPRLIKFGRQTNEAAKKLGEALNLLLSAAN